MSYQAVKRQRGTLPSERCQSQKAILYSPNYMTFWKGENSEDSEKVSGQSPGVTVGQRVERWSGGFLGRRKYPLRYNDK